MTAKQTTVNRRVKPAEPVLNGCEHDWDLIAADRQTKWQQRNRTRAPESSAGVEGLSSPSSPTPSHTGALRGEFTGAPKGEYTGLPKGEYTRVSKGEYTEVLTGEYTGALKGE